METKTQQAIADQLAAMVVGSGPWLGGLVFSGCKDHPHRTDLSCCKIRRADGTPLSVADTWEEIHRLRSGIDCATNALTDSILCSGNDAATNMHFVRKLKALLSAPNNSGQTAGSQPTTDSVTNK